MRAWMSIKRLYATSGNPTAKVINGLLQEKRNSSVLAIELRLSCTNPLI